jgi:hypothetical protein
MPCHVAAYNKANKASKAQCCNALFLLKYDLKFYFILPIKLIKLNRKIEKFVIFNSLRHHFYLSHWNNLLVLIDVCNSTEVSQKYRS